jgi:Reverse transcriptase (RNA-dependent DNA polymerase)
MEGKAPYSPVATWAAIRLIMNMAALHGWTTKQLDFVLAFPQASVETDLYMEIPAGFKVASNKNKVLKLIDNLYGQKQAGRVWNNFLNDGLIKIGFTQSENDPCVFWRNATIIVIYTDDTKVTGPNEEEINKAINHIGNQFKITHQPRVKDFLGVKVDRDQESGTTTFTQPQLIESILKDVGLTENSNSRDMPALSSKIIHSYKNSPRHKESWSYRSVIGKLKYLEKCICARFASDPREEHSKAVKLIARYLKGLATEESYALQIKIHLSVLPMLISWATGMRILLNSTDPRHVLAQVMLLNMQIVQLFGLRDCNLRSP